jgi:predicted transcriptional regulator
MKAVLISIQPKWCELIASGKKTVEVRKTKPKIDVPFKCYIYETQGRTETPWIDEDGHEIFKGRGQVIGEFVCDNILDYTLDPYGHHSYFISDDDFESTCLTFYEELWDYGKGKTLYGWHISDLVIYDKPKELSEFYQEGKNGDKFYYDYCAGCPHHETPVGEGPCNGCDGNRNYLYRPPQSWCYVEEGADNEQRGF